MKSQVFSSFKAQPSGKGEIPDTVIEFSTEIPDTRDLAEQASLFDEEASKLETWLYHTLPGGLYDHLFAKMARRRASLFVVTHGRH